MQRTNIKVDYRGRPFEVGCLVEIHYPYMYSSGGCRLPVIAEILELKESTNRSGFYCEVSGWSYDPMYLQPIKYKSKNIELLYAKK